VRAGAFIIVLDTFFDAVRSSKRFDYRCARETLFAALREAMRGEDKNNVFERLQSAAIEHCLSRKALCVLGGNYSPTWREIEKAARRQPLIDDYFYHLVVDYRCNRLSL
jgi:hypothetical protein